MRVKCIFVCCLKNLVVSLLLILVIPFNIRAVDDMEDLIPVTFCGAGWNIDGKPISYDRNTLPNRINGEAELYYLYGFDRMIAGRYTWEKRPEIGLDVEIYRMGSLIEAFGMYSNYRQKEGNKVSIGTDSNLSGSQLFFYQGRNFVHIQMTGMDEANSYALTECGRSIESRLPGARTTPPEISVFNRLQVVKGSERYIPRSLLGYDFLNNGIMCDAVVEGTDLQIMRLLSTSTESATAAFNSFRLQLSQARIDSGANNVKFLSGVDPLYGPVIVIRKGGCLAAALKYKVVNGIYSLLESVCN